MQDVCDHCSGNDNIWKLKFLQGSGETHASCSEKYYYNFVANVLLIWSEIILKISRALERLIFNRIIDGVNF